MYHSQNLNDSRRPRFGGKARHGRAWWGPLAWEWAFFWDKPCHLCFSRGGFSLALVVFSIHVHWDGDNERDGREFRLAIHDWAIWLNLWHDPMGGWSRDQPFLERTFVFHVLDFFLGRMKYERIEGESFVVKIPMPEGTYPAKVTYETRTWWRSRWPRWPFKLVRDTCDVTIPGGIPFMGKGENDYDCGEDGLYGTGSEGHNIPKAIAQVVRSVLESRERYGTPKRIRDKIDAA